jgi:hypothetical protein
MSPDLPLDPAGTGLAVIGLAGALGVGLVFVQAGLAKLRRSPVPRRAGAGRLG